MAEEWRVKLINVDVYVPAMDRTYNFNLDEEASILMLMDEISELICKKEHSSVDGAKELFIMGSLDKKVNFDSKCSLKDYSIKNGDTLILV